MAADDRSQIISIAMLLQNPRVLELEEVEQAAECAFEIRFNTPTHKLVKVPGKPMFALLMDHLALGIINSSSPYFGDIAQAADATRNFAIKQAIQQHTAWISVDVMGDASAVDRNEAYSMIGQLLAELIQPGTLAFIRTPDGQTAAYDKCFLQLLQSGNAQEIFKLKSVDEVMDTPPDDAELAAATKEARRRWPEFLQAFAARRPSQGFGVKKRFTQGNESEHMWAAVKSIEGKMIRGELSNEPVTLVAMTLGDPVMVNADEITDWVYTDGQKTLGGFQIAVLNKRRPKQ